VAVVEFSKDEVTLDKTVGLWRLRPEGEDYRLEIRLMYDPTWSYRVKVVDKDYLELYIPLRESPQIMLQRVVK